MALDSSNVLVSRTGTVSYGPLGTTPPTDASSPLDPAMLDVGYLNPDGVTEARERGTSNVQAWQNSARVRVLVTESGATVNFTMIETKKASIELYYGAVVQADGSIDVDPGETGGRRCVVVDYVDGVKFVRLWIPDGEVLEVGDQSNTSADATAYEVTIHAYPSTALDGKSFRKWYSELAA